MNAGQKKLLGFLVLALPFAAMLLMIGMNAQNMSHKEYRVKIEGYDPRDLLRGHYLIFRYVWPERAQESAQACWDNGNSCCACFNGEAEAPDIEFGNCAHYAAQENICQATLPMIDSAGGTPQPHENLLRYYIPEAEARNLEDWLRGGMHNFEVGIVPLPEGQGAQLKMLYIDGQKLPQFLRDLPRTAPPVGQP